MPRLALLPLALLVAWLPLGCQSPGERGLPPTSALVAQGDRALAEGRHVEARELLSREVATRPNSWLGWIGLTRVGLATGDRALVEQSLLSAQALTGENPEKRELLARTLLEVARASSAGERRQHALAAARLLLDVERRAPDTSRLAYHTGVAKLLLEEPASASRLALREIERDVTFEPGWNLYVEALHQQGLHSGIVTVLEDRAKTFALTAELDARLEAARRQLGAKPASSGAKPVSDAPPES